VGKGSHRRPAAISDAELERRWTDAFGPRPLPNVMSDEERKALLEDLDKLAAGGRATEGDLILRRVILQGEATAKAWKMGYVS
jgi:hypothetical protein